MPRNPRHTDVRERVRANEAARVLLIVARDATAQAREKMSAALPEHWALAAQEYADSVLEGLDELVRIVVAESDV